MSLNPRTLILPLRGLLCWARQIMDQKSLMNGGDWKLFVQLNGPAGARLGSDGIVTELPSVDFDLGIIAGSRSSNSYYSHLITGQDDGKVSIEATKVAGMKDHIVLPVTHTFMMNSGEVLNQALHFFQKGYFRKE